MKSKRDFSKTGRKVLLRHLKLFALPASVHYRVEEMPQEAPESCSRGDQKIMTQGRDCSVPGSAGS